MIALYIADDVLKSSLISDLELQNQSDFKYLSYMKYRKFNLCSGVGALQGDL